MSETTAPRAGASVPPPRENLVRALSEAPTLERSDGETMPTLTGHFAVFDQWTEINSVFEGNFMERFAPGAFAKTIRESKDQMRVLFDHGHDPSIGNKPLGPISSLREDSIGTNYAVPMLDTSYNRELIPGLDAGLYGASFRFKVMQETFVTKPKASRSNPDGLPERTVTEAQVREFGPVVFPAYAGATAGLRSMTDEFLFARFVDDPDKLLELLEAYKERRDDETKVTTSVFIKGEKIAENVTSRSPRLGDVTYDNYDPNYKTLPLMEPEPSAATTPVNVSIEAAVPNVRTEPEPSAATTRVKAHRAGIYPYREEKPSWLL